MAKQAVAKAKEECYKEWYENLGTKEGEETIYRIAKQRTKARADIGEIKVVRDQNGVMLTDNREIKERWREYFNSLLNVENTRETLEETPQVERRIEELTMKETTDALKKMKKRESRRMLGNQRRYDEDSRRGRTRDTP